MMHSTGNKHMPFIAIPQRHEVSARFDWLAKYTLTGLVGFFVLGVLTQFIKSTPPAVSSAPTTRPAAHRSTPAGLALRSDSAGKRERESQVNPPVSRIGATPPRARTTSSAEVTPPDTKPVPAAALRPLSSRTSQAAVRPAATPAAPPSAPPVVKPAPSATMSSKDAPSKLALSKAPPK